MDEDMFNDDVAAGEQESVTTLARVLAARGMSQAELARRLGVSESAVSKYVHGERVPRIDIAFRAAKALEVAPEHLWRDAIRCEVKNCGFVAYKDEVIGVVKEVELS